MSQAFVGEIKLLGFGWAPRGFMLCAGQTLAINAQTALFSLLSTAYGGDGVSTFKLPDLRSRAAFGQGQGLGLSNYQLGQTGGVEHTTLSIANMPVHNHLLTGQITATPTVAVTSVVADQANPTGNVLAKGRDATTGAIMQNYSDTAATGTLGGVSCTVSNTLAVGTSGGSTPFSVLNPSLAINYVIAIEGIYPSRN